MAGNLITPYIGIEDNGELRLGGGSVTNSKIALGNGIIRSTISQTRQFGQLYVGATALARIYFGNSTTVLRFSDSRDLAWYGSGKLAVLNWSGFTNGRGTDQLYVGTTSDGLTTTQLARITFSDPEGLPPGTYPARILPTGEIVPGDRPAVAFARAANQFILSWNGNAELLSATNVSGPWFTVTAASPWTNSVADSQRYFQLRSLPP